MISYEVRRETRRALQRPSSSRQSPQPAESCVDCTAQIDALAHDVADLLQINTSHIRKVRHERIPRAITDYRRWCYLRLQFELEGPDRDHIQGLGQVLADLPAALLPLTVAGLLIAPQSNLLNPATDNIDAQDSCSRATVIAVRLVSSLNWLSSGGSAELVIEAVHDAELQLPAHCRSRSICVNRSR